MRAEFKGFFHSWDFEPQKMTYYLPKIKRKLSSILDHFQLHYVSPIPTKQLAKTVYGCRDEYFFYFLFFNLAIFNQQLGYADDSRINKWINDHIEVLHKDIKIYHWATHNQIDSSDNKFLLKNYDESIDCPTPFSSSHPCLRRYIDQMSRNFHLPQNKIRKHKWTLGEGLYFAMDPITSINLAPKDRIMFEVTLKKGTKFLNLHASSNKIWKGQSFKEIYYYQPAFRQSLYQKLQQLGISLILYRWDTSIYPYCSRRYRNSAFNIINSKIINDFSVYSRHQVPTRQTILKNEKMKSIVKTIIHMAFPIDLERRDFMVKEEFNLSKSYELDQVTLDKYFFGCHKESL